MKILIRAHRDQNGDSQISIIREQDVPSLFPDADIAVMDFRFPIWKQEPVAHIVKHSPTGMSWGYGGSGPADTALSLLTHLFDREFAENHYQSFKWDTVARWPNDQEVLVEIDITRLEKAYQDHLAEGMIYA